MEKTRKEIEDLKLQWMTEPIWDIYSTEGFEDYHEELYAYQQECELMWKQRAENEFIEFQKMIGTKNKKLSKYLYAMAKKIQSLESEVSVLKGIKYN